jgi:hypothetical protein
MSVYGTNVLEDEPLIAPIGAATPQISSVGSALTGGDPLMTSIYNLGLADTSAWNPAQEAARKDKSWGQTAQKVGERYSRAGLTGSSQELGDLANTAKSFELDWNERKPKQMESAIAATLPIQNFRRSVANDALAQSNTDRLFKQTQDSQNTALWGNLLASSGLPTWLSSILFGTGTPAVSGTSTGGLAGQGLNALLKLLGGGSNPQAGNYTVDQLNAMDPAIDWNSVNDWWNQNYLTDTGWNAATDIGDVYGGLSLADLSGYW